MKTLFSCCFFLPFFLFLACRVIVRLIRIYRRKEKTQAVYELETELGICCMRKLLVWRIENEGMENEEQNKAGHNVALRKRWHRLVLLRVKTKYNGHDSTLWLWLVVITSALWRGTHPEYGCEIKPSLGRKFPFPAIKFVEILCPI